MTIGARTGNTSTSGNARTGNVAAQPREGRTTSNLTVNGLTDAVKSTVASVSTFSRPPAESNTIPNESLESVKLSSDSSNYNAVMNKGFNSFRPEILAAFQFEPVYEDDNNIPGPVGKMLDFQIAARRLQAENVMRLVNELKTNPETSSIISRIEEEISQHEEAANKEIQFLDSLVRVLNASKTSFNVKLNSNKIKAEIQARRDIQGRNKASISRNVRPTKTLSELMVDDLKFSSQGFAKFTNTKIIGQLIDDLRAILTSFSPQIFDLPNADRENDLDPTRLSRIDDQTIGSAIEFDIANLSLSSQADVQSGATSNALTSYMSSLSQVTNHDDRLKILFSLLSKELRVSTGLSLKNIKTIATSVFSETNIDGSIFEKMLGNIGNEVLSSIPPPENSISSLLRLVTADGVVLPFEQSAISTNAFQEYIPGGDFYVDSIVRGNNIFDSTQLNEYATALNSGVTGLAAIVEGTLDVNAVNNDRLGLNVDDLMDRAFRSIHDSAKSISDKDSTRDTFIPALLISASSDQTMRYYLYLYMLIFGYEKSDKFGVENKFFETMQSAGLTRAVVASAIKAAFLEPFVNPVQGLIDRAGNTSDIILISEMIMERVYFRFRKDTVDPSKSSYLGNFAFNHLTGLGAGTSQDNLFLSMFSMLNSLDNICRSAITATQSTDNSDAYFSNTHKGLTKFNNIGVHQMVMVVLDIFITTYTKFAPIMITGVKSLRSLDTSTSFSDALKVSSPGIEIDIDDDAFTVMEHSLFQFLDSGSRLSAGIDLRLDRDMRFRIGAQLGDLNNIRQKASNEDLLVRDIVDALLSIMNMVVASAAEAKSFFDPKGSNATLLESIALSIDSNEKLSALDAAQVSLARVELDDHIIARSTAASDQTNAGALSSDVSPFIDDTATSPDVRNSVFSLAKQPEFLGSAETSMKVLAVGIPAGFNDALKRKLDFFFADRSATKIKGSLSGIIKMNVYMQDAMFDDVIFKPKEYIFEMGRFVSADSFKNNVQEVMAFNNITTKIKHKVALSGSPLLESGVGIAALNSPEYEFLSDTQKLELITNHTKSYILRTYIKILTGVDMRENNFFLNDEVASMRVDSTTHEEFNKLLALHVSQFLNRKLTFDEIRASSDTIDRFLTKLDNDESLPGIIEKIANSFPAEPHSANIEISQDLVTFLNVFSSKSVLFGAGARRQKVLSPKLFERIFMLALDANDFEIDIEKTRSTTSGRTFLDSNTIVSGLTKVSTTTGQTTIDTFKVNYDVLRPKGAVGIQQFFVSIEHMPAADQVASPVPAQATEISFGNSGPRETPTTRTVSHGAAKGLASSTRTAMATKSEITRLTKPDAGLVEVL